MFDIIRLLPALILLLGCSTVYKQAPAGEGARPPTAGVGSLTGVLSSLVWPLASNQASIVSSKYGVRRNPSGNGRRFHAGLDLRADQGTAVHAVANGRVLTSGRSGAYGNLVIVDHGADLHSLYAHHVRNLVREGETVRRGQVIARVGHTGNATGDHLHFELRWRGGTVDPLTVLPPLEHSSR